MSNGQRSERRHQIQAVAEQLFQEKGYLATSMRDIADAMKMKGGGSLYAHIKSKEDLLWDIADEAINAFFRALEPILARDMPPDQKLRDAMIAHMLTITAHLGSATVYFDEWRHLTEPRRTEFMARRDEYEHLFGRLIHEGIAAGALCPLDEGLARLYILGAMNEIRRWYRPGGRLSALEVAANIAGMILGGLCRRDEPL